MTMHDLAWLVVCILLVIFIFTTGIPLYWLTLALVVFLMAMVFR